MERIILHCDLNSFFASVELLSYPELREQPVAVCGDPKSRHGIILAKNEPAKAKGVKTKGAAGHHAKDSGESYGNGTISGLFLYYGSVCHQRCGV